MFYDLAIDTAGIWRSSDGGGTWNRVLDFGSRPDPGQI
jgi:hypothetical protein